MNRSIPVPLVVAGALAFAWGFYALVWPQTNGDMQSHVQLWLGHLRAGGFSALSGEFANYAPPYLYVLSLTAPFKAAPDLILIKALSMLFAMIAACVVGLIVFEATGERRRAWFAGAGFLVLPTVLMNCAYWGQCDVVYTTFLLCFVLAMLKDKPAIAMIALGVALSFKAQAVLIGPFVLYLLLTKRIRFWHLPIPAIAYVAMMTPAALAGRPWADLLLVYASQAETYHELSKNAPNLYSWHADPPLTEYRLLSLAGTILAAIGGLALAVRGRSLVRGRETDLILAAASVLLMPFLLPKMHDRYFFPADALTFVLAVAFPRYWPVAVLVQLGSLTAYTNYLFEYGDGGEVGGLFMAGAIYMFWRIWRRGPSLTSGAGPAPSGASS